MEPQQYAFIRISDEAAELYDDSVRNFIRVAADGDPIGLTLKTLTADHEPMIKGHYIVAIAEKDHALYSPEAFEKEFEVVEHFLPEVDGFGLAQERS